LELEECENTPTIDKLYKIIMEMSIKQQKLEEKVEELSKYVDTKKKKINILEWLNITYTTCVPFDKWMTTIKVERKHLENVFNHDFVYGSIELLNEFIVKGASASDSSSMANSSASDSSSSSSSSSIRAYDQKENILYIVGADDNTWCEMSQSQSKKLFDYISKQFLHEFVTWQNENKHRMEDDNYAMTYMKNIKKINGGNYTTEELYRKIQRQLYKSLKTNLRNIIQYDIC